MNTELDIDACKQGDRAALEKLYKAYSNKLMRICLYYIHDENVAKDVLHDAFIIIFTSIKSLKDNSKLDGWMITILRNLALKYLRDSDNKELPLSYLNIEIPNEENTSEQNINLEILLSAIDALPKGNREIFKLSVLDGLSHNEIANLLGINPHSSSSQLFRAKKMLRIMLSNYWILFILPILIPFYIYFITKDNSKDSFDNHMVSVKTKKHSQSVKRHHNLDQETILPRRTTINVSSPCVSVSDSIKPYNMSDNSSIFATILENRQSIFTDSLSNNMTIISHVLDTLLYISTATKDINISPVNIAYNYKSPRKRYPWTFNFGYNTTSSGNSMSNLNYLSVIDYARGGVMSKIYSWSDYLNYLDRNSSSMDSLENARLRKMAEDSFHSADNPVGEKAHHYRPKTYSISLNKRLNSYLTFGTGLMYTHLKSKFESTFNNTSLLKTQKIDYIGLPLRLTYSFWHKGRLNAYTTGGVTFELPVHSSLTRTFTISPDSSFTQKRDIRPLPQWSVNLGVGVQYPIFKPVGIYIEPNVFYYFNNGSGIQTYRTEHPFMFSVPFGIRLTW